VVRIHTEVTKRFFLLLLNVFSSLHKCVVNSLSFLVSVLLRRNVSLCFWATVSALVCLVCSSRLQLYENYDDDDDDKVIKILTDWEPQTRRKHANTKIVERGSTKYVDISASQCTNPHNQK